MKRLENKKVEYCAKLLKSLDDKFLVDKIIQMHTFWSGFFGEKQFGCIKSLFATQKKYKFNVTLWVDDDFKIEASI